MFLYILYLCWLLIKTPTKVYYQVKEFVLCPSKRNLAFHLVILLISLLPIYVVYALTVRMVFLLYLLFFNCYFFFKILQAPRSQKNLRSIVLKHVPLAHKVFANTLSVDQLVQVGVIPSAQSRARFLLTIKYLFYHLPISWALEIAINLLIFFVGNRPKSSGIKVTLLRYGRAVFCVVLFCLPYWWFVYLVELATKVQSGLVQALEDEKKKSLKLYLSLCHISIIGISANRQYQRVNFLAKTLNNKSSVD